MDLNSKPLQPVSPTDEERYALVKSALAEQERPEDFNNVKRLLSPPPDITTYAAPGEFKGKRVGIIGGGVAGMAAAFELRKLGFDITIYEALENRIGGRIYTYYFDEEKKYYGELGAMRIPVSHETSWHYINLFKLKTLPFIQSNPNTFVYVKNTRTRSSSKDITEKIFPLFNLTPRERRMTWDELYSYAFSYLVKRLKPSVRTEILKILKAYSPEYEYMIDSSVRNVMEDLKLSEEAINLLTSVDPFGAFLYNSYNEQIMEIYPVSFRYLYRIDGGTSNLPLAFYNSLTSSHPEELKAIPKKDIGTVTWKGGQHVTDIYYSEKDKKVVLGYANTSETVKARESFDYVVCTIPYSTLRAVNIHPLFSNRKMQAIREINYSPSKKTLFFCNKRFWEENRDYGKINGGISTTDMMIQTIVYPSDHYNCSNLNYSDIGQPTVPQLRKTNETYCSPGEPGVITASYNFNLDATRLGNAPEPTRFNITKRQVEMVHGLPQGYLDSVVRKHISFNWNNAPWQRGAFAIFNPAQKRIFSYEMLMPEYNNHIYFAGEHTSATHAWIQGALQTAMYAANNLAYNAKMEQKG
jgi:monoamine oxidase